jgi:hypothetical protein
MVAVFERISERTRRAARGLALAGALAAATPVAVALPAAAALSAAAAVTAVAPATASAGEFHLYSCRTPAGESAPTNGWSGSVTGTASLVEDTCGQAGGALVAGLEAKIRREAGTTEAIWAFDAPAGETIAGATLWRAGDADGGLAGNSNFVFRLAGPTDEEPFDECSPFSGCPDGKGDTEAPLSSGNLVVEPSANWGAHLYVLAACMGGTKYLCPEGSGDSNGYAAVVYLYAADLILEQSAPPSASNVSGELASAATVSGTSDVAFSASDPASGVYEAVFSVDGKVVQSTVVDEDEGRCRNVGQTTDGLAAFLYVQPCPASVNADVGFDTASVSNGEHHLVVSVIDAAGNAATVLDRNVTVYNPPPPGGPNGTNASAHATLAVGWEASAKGAKLAGARLTSSYGHAHTIAGRLTGASGAAIGAAQVDVLSTPDYAGAKQTLTSVLTGADGRFTLSVPAGSSSRTLRFQYSDDVGASPVATRTLTLSVRAGVSLSVAPHTTSVGRSIRFSGRLLGGPVPAGGKLLVLEARSPRGAWLEFDVVRSDARGRFYAGYRFKFPGPADYQFRVLCEAEADYPFATGASRVVGVFER